MMMLLTAFGVFMGIFILGWLIRLHRDMLRLHSDVKKVRSINEQLLSEQEKSSESGETNSKTSRQIVHDLNNLLSTMGGFAEAALEDVASGDPIRNDLREISDAAHRAKGVVRQLSHTIPKPERFDSTLSLSDIPSARPVTSTYEVPKSISSDRISYTPSAKPVSEYRHTSHPPMATPVPSISLSSYPPPPKHDMSDTGNIRRTSTFPSMRQSVLSRSSTGDVLRETSEKNTLDVPLRNGKPRLIIVDDEIQLLTMFRRVFEPQGYEVTTYSDSLEAWNDFQKNASRFDLAILDQRMPEMSGSSLATEMIAIRPDFPIILLTGYSDTVSPDDAARIGIRKYLSKPIPQAKLSATIRNILDETSA